MCVHYTMIRKEKEEMRLWQYVRGHPLITCSICISIPLNFVFAHEYPLNFIIFYRAPNLLKFCFPSMDET